MPSVTRASTVKLSEDTFVRLQALAEGRRHSPHALMCQAIEEFVDREERLARLDRDTHEAWVRYKETGEAVEGDAVLAWLSRWGTPEDGPLHCSE